MFWSKGSEYFEIKVNSTKGITHFNTDLYGQWHNEGLDYVLGGLLKENILPNNEIFNVKFNQKLNEFYALKNIDVSANFNGDFNGFSNEINYDFCNDVKTMSSEGAKIACSIKENIDNLINEKISLNDYVLKAEDLRIESEKITDENEKIICGLTASISKHSAQFWFENYDKYYNAFSIKSNEINHGGPNINNEENIIKVSLWKTLGADAMGAWRWGRVGAVVAGGPAGAIACGLAGAAGHSCASIIVNHVISH